MVWTLQSAQKAAGITPTKPASQSGGMVTQSPARSNTWTLQSAQQAIQQAPKKITTGQTITKQPVSVQKTAEKQNLIDKVGKKYIATFEDVAKKLPEFHFADKENFYTPVGFAAHLAQGTLNTPKEAMRGAVHYKETVQNKTITPKSAAGDIAAMLQLPLLFVGGGEAKSIAETAGKGTLKTFGMAFGKSTGIGAAFGTLTGLQSGRDIQDTKEYVKNLLTNIGIGAVSAGLLHGVTDVAVPLAKGLPHQAGAVFLKMTGKTPKIEGFHLDPKAAQSMVITNGLDKTPAGKAIMKEAIAAEQAGEHVSVMVDKNGKYELPTGEKVNITTEPIYDPKQVRAAKNRTPEHVVQSSEKSTRAPMEDIISVKNESEASLANSDKYMNDALKGEGVARKPITGVKLKNGKYVVTDGNATFQTLKKNGYTDIPMEVTDAEPHLTDEAVLKLINEKVNQPEKPVSFTGNTEEDAQALIKTATKYNQLFKNKVDEVAKDIGAKVMHGSIKKVERVIEKAKNDYGGDVSRVQDTNRSTIVIDDPKKYQEYLNAIKKKFDVIREKNTLSNEGGYKSGLINVKFDNGLTAEIQLVTPEYLKAKKELGGHELYNMVRVKMSGWEEAEKKMNNLYAEAERSLSERLNASSSTSEPSANALTGGKGLPEDVSPKTSFEASSRSTLTSTSSTSKNRGNGLATGETPFKQSIAQEEGKSNNQSVRRVLNTKETQYLQDIIDTKLNHARQVSGNEGEYIKNINELYKDITDKAGNDKVVLSSLRTQLQKEIDGIVGKTGNYKADYATFQEMLKQDDEIGRMLNVLDDKVKALDDKLLTAKEVMQPKPEVTKQEKTGGNSTGNFETAGTGKLKESRHFKRLTQYLEENDPATYDKVKDDPKLLYNTVNQKYDFENAAKIVEENPQKAYNIAKGIEKAPAGQRWESVNVVLADRALEEGNIPLWKDLEKNLTYGLTREGQGIVTVKGRFDLNSPHNFVKQVLDTRLARIGKTVTDSIDTSVEQLKSAKAKGLAKIDQAVEKAYNFTKKERAKIDFAQSLLDQLTCK